MTKVIAGLLMNLILVLPIIIFTLQDKTKETGRILIAFAAFYLMNGVLLSFPLEFKEIGIGQWNWTGKLLAIFGSILFILLYKKFDLKDYFLTLKQDKSFIKKGLLVITILLLVKSLMTFIYGSPEEWDTETILFQLTMPGINEEIAYRGIMLGLLAKTLKPAKRTIFHPAILVTAILFGLGHGFFLNSSFEISFNAFPFFNSLMMGIIWGWITMQSGSILLALISHNLGNVTIRLVGMR
jgi:uncharacterized protein